MTNNMTMEERREIIERRKRREKRRKENKRRRIINTSIASAIVMVIAFLLLNTVELSKQNKALTDKVNNLESTKSVINEQLCDAYETINDLNEIIEKQDDQIINLSTVNKSMVDELNQLRTRSELYNKYEYAIIDEVGVRTELTYEEIELGETLMLAKGYDPHLMMGSIMVESHGNPNAVNSSSGATGYGQFLNSTAKWVWEDLLGRKNYYSDIRKDGESNITMMAEYYDYLYKSVGTTFSVVKCYSGNSTDSGAASYLKKINKHTSRVGVVVK